MLGSITVGVMDMFIVGTGGGWGDGKSRLFSSFFTGTNVFTVI